MLGKKLDVLVVMQTEYKSDLSKLPKEELEMHTFLNGISGYKICAIATLLNRKRISDKIENKIKNILDHPHVGSVVKFYSGSGYI